MGGQGRTTSALAREIASINIVQEAGWAPKPVWTGMESRKRLVATEVQTPGHPDLSESTNTFCFNMFVVTFNIVLR